MEYTIFVAIELTQQPHKHDIPFQNTIFLAFYYRIYVLCGYWHDSTLTQTKHDIPFQKTVLLAFYKEYTICGGIESDSTAPQTRYFVSKHHFLAFCLGIYDLCGYWVYSTATKTRYPITKHHVFSVLRLKIRIVRVLGRLSTYTSTIFICKAPFFNTTIGDLRITRGRHF